MKLMPIYRNILIAICILCLPACDNQWDDHIEVKNNREKETIMQVIASNPETSDFAAILKKTGYDVFLSGDKSVTVFAPSNSALASAGISGQSDEETLLSLVKNHIAYLSYPLAGGQFATDAVEMINTKRVKANNGKIGNIAMDGEAYNITTSNGLLHVISGVITTRKSVWEYLSAKSGYAQIDFIKSLDNLEMDTERSVQVGIDEQARPVYDTIWVNRNVVLDQYQLNNEEEDYTFILVNSTVADRVKAKYAKYFVRPEQAQQDSLLEVEFFKDCVLLPVEISGNGKYLSVDGVEIEVSNKVAEYQASNGIVYEFSDADVKVYENKIKTFIIEGEDYTSVYADGNAWSKRTRNWASGEADMMMNSQSRNFFRWDTLNADGVTMNTVTQTFTYYYNSNAAAAYGYMGRVSNCYIEFNPVLNSVGYKIYAVAHDDIPWHYNGSNTFSSDNWYPMIQEEKLLISFPDAPKLSRNGDRKIDNNFKNDAVFVTKSVAGDTPAETQFLRYKTDTTESNVGFFMVTGDAGAENFFDGSDAFGDKEQLICPRYGKSTLYIANTVRIKDVYGGMIFLDYIKFVPLVDVTD